MLQTNVMPARNLQKFYKAVIEQVKLDKQPVILTTNEQPQAVIISLEDLDRLNTIKATQTAIDILDLADAHKKELRNLPPDLRAKADSILYDRL